MRDPEHIVEDFFNEGDLGSFAEMINQCCIGEILDFVAEMIEIAQKEAYLEGIKNKQL